MSIDISEALKALDNPTRLSILAWLKEPRKNFPEQEVNADEVHIILINGVSSPPDRVLGEGDRLGLFPAVGGG